MSYWKMHPPVHILVGNFFEKDTTEKVPTEEDLDQAVHEMNR